MKYLLILSLLFIPNAYAWDGYDDNGHSIEIEQGNLVREGEDIEVYDYDDGEYKDITVESITSYGDSVEIEAYDNDSGEYVTYEMDKD